MRVQKKFQTSPSGYAGRHANVTSGNMFNDASVSGSVAGCVRDKQCPGDTICCPDGSCAVNLDLCNGKK